jgi:glycosyltransferase involved in cell wall biosynthesis
VRISIVTGFFLPVPALQGGATERSWEGLARIFAAAGHTVTFISRRWPGLPDSELRDGVAHLRLPGFDHSRRLPVNLLRDLRWGMRVARSLPPADLVICNTVTLPAWLPWLRPSAGRVATMIGRVPKGQVPFYGRVRRIYVPSSGLAGQITSERARRITRVIGYPIDWERLARAAAPSRAPVTIGYVGRIHPEKGLAVLLEAAVLLARRPDLPDWRLRLVGPVAVSAGGGGQAWAEQLRAAAAPLGARVEWSEPEFDPERLARHYGQMDVFCYPSLADQGETFGVGVAEAMAAHCAVVVSALPCFRDLVTPGETGLTFTHGGSDAAERLAAELARLLLDPALRRRLADRGQAHVRRFSYEEVSRTILADLAVLAGASAENPPR